MTVRMTWNLAAIALLLPGVAAAAAVAWQPLLQDGVRQRTDVPALDCDRLELEGKRLERICQGTRPSALPPGG